MKTKFNGILTLLLVFSVHFAFAQKTVSGTVSDETGPLPGVSVLIQGTTTGTETDFDGKYLIQANTGDVLQYSYIGMETAFRTVGASNVIDVTMDSSGNILDEVVVTAYGIKRAKKSLTYQTEKVSEDDLVASAPNSAGQALAGKVAGLQINVQDNGVNPTTQVLLRGLRSISKTNTALFIIDGSKSSQGAFDDLNPNDIENMTILKGANAAALYGADAGNGAVIVTTKKGKKNDKFKFGISSATSIEEVAYMPEMQTEYGTGWQGIYNPVENTNWGPRFDGVVRQIGPTFADGSFQAVPYAPVEDNLKNFYDTGMTLNNVLYFTGGTENSQFYMSVGDQRTKGIVPSDEYDRNTFRVNASTKIDNLTLSANTSYFRDNTNVVGDELGDQDRQLYWFVLNTPANIPLETYSDWENDLYATPDGYFNAYYQNPYWAIGTARDEDQSNRINGNLSASWDTFDWLNLRATLGVNRVSGRGKEWRAAQTYDPVLQPAHSAVSSYVEDSEYQITRSTMDFVASSSFNFNETFDLKVILGAANDDYRSDASAIRATNLLIDDFYDISNGVAGNLNQATTQKRVYGFFGDVNLGYKDFVYLYASGRNDWTSTLADGENSYFYPSFGASLVLTEAISSLQGNSLLNYAKATYSNSTVYNDAGAKQINERFYQSGTFPFEGINGFYYDPTAVSDLIKKEQLVTNEFGLNLGFFNNRITFDGAYFMTDTYDLITFVSPAPSSGADNYLTNIGELAGKGFEASLGAKVFDGSFKWDVNVNYTTNETTVVDIADPTRDDEEVATYTWHNMGIYAVEGDVYPQLQGSAYVRDPQGRVVIDASTGNPLIGEFKSFGRTTPKHIVGLTNTFTYKDLSLTATFDYRTGHVYYSQLADFMEFTGRSMESVSANREDFVWPNSVVEVSEGVYEENATIPITGGRQNFWNNHFNEIAENYAIDATAVKIRELSLNYSVPQKLIEKTGLSKINLGLVSRNLLTWLPAENRFADPEFGNSNNNNIGVGGFLQSPPTRTFGFKVNVEF